MRGCGINKVGYVVRQGEKLALSRKAGFVKSLRKSEFLKGKIKRAGSSVGRASALHAEGQEFESPPVHRGKGGYS